MANTRSISFSGYVIETTVTDQALVADTWVRNITSTYSGQKIIVGLDSEWRPNQNSNMHNKTALLQLCVDTKCLILQMFYMDFIPQSLKNFLVDPNVTFVGVEVARDVAKLRDEYGLPCSNAVDVRELAMRNWPHHLHSKSGLIDVARLVVGLVMTKPEHVSRSDWQQGF